MNNRFDGFSWFVFDLFNMVPGDGFDFSYFRRFDNTVHAGFDVYMILAHSYMNALHKLLYSQSIAEMEICTDW